MDTNTDPLFAQARTQNGCLDTPVPDSQLQAQYELLKWGPTSANCCPARLIFVRTEEAKARPAACAAAGNQGKLLPPSPRLSFERACQFA